MNLKLLASLKKTEIKQLFLGIDYVIKLFLKNVLVCHNGFASSIYFAVVPSCVMNVKEGRY